MFFQINHFEQELREMRSRSNDFSLNLGDSVDKERMCQKTHQLFEVHKDLKTNVKVCEKVDYNDCFKFFFISLRFYWIRYQRLKTQIVLFGPK